MGKSVVGEKIVGAVRQVIGLLVQGMEFEIDSWRNFESEVRTLIAPDLPALAHQRARLLDGKGDWSSELDRFMEERLWPRLGDDRSYAERNRTFLTLLLDVTIAAEQRRAPNPSNAGTLPLVALDAHWAR
jgi:hypothetical protein